MSSPEEQIALLKSRLKHWTEKDDKTSYACCPAHGDHHPSLCITKAESGKVLLYCWSRGCTGRQILKSIGLGFSGDGISSVAAGPTLTPEDQTPVELHTTDIFSWPIKATYVYTDGQGNEVLKVERRDSPVDPKRKGFFQMTKDDRERWVMRVMPGTPIPPYNLDAILNTPDKPIWVVEGEKAAEALIAQGELATTNPGGAGKWNKISPQFRQVFNNRHIIILPDADDVGRSHATDVALSVEGSGAASIKIVDLYPGQNSKLDVFDFLKISKLTELQKLVRHAPEFRMDPETTGFDLPGGSKFVSLAHPSIALKGRDFLVPKVIMTGALVLLAGKGSAGKSSLCGHIAAKVSQGLPVFGLDPVTDYWNKVPKGNVIWVSKEEGPETELASRLVSEGAALERIFILKEGSLNLDDPDEVEQLLCSRRPALIILDPLTSYIGGDENSNKGVRATLENLLQAIHKEGLPTAILGLVHMNKTGKDDEADVNKVLGSVGLPNLSRSTLMVRKNKDGTREMAIAKANFRAREDNLLFGIESLDETEGLRVIEASGMTVAADKKKIVDSMCRVNIINWVMPATDKERAGTSKSYEKEILEAVGESPGLTLDELHDLLVEIPKGLLKQVLWNMKQANTLRITAGPGSDGLLEYRWYLPFADRAKQGPKKPAVMAEDE